MLAIRHHARSTGPVQDIGALCNLGLLLLFERNDPDEAEQMYRRVLEVIFIFIWPQINDSAQ